MLNFVIAECHICAVSIIANAPLYSRNRRDRAADRHTCTLMKCHSGEEKKKEVLFNGG